MNWKTGLRTVLLGFVMVVAPRAFAASADLKVEVTVTPQNAQVGGIIQYHCVVTNLGPDVATNINGSAGPDNTDSAPNPSTDKYTTYDHGVPEFFFKDSTNFLYFRLINGSGQIVSQLNSGETGTFDVFYKATQNGNPQRRISVVSADASDPVQGNNSVVVSSTIGSGPPTHGGLSGTSFTVNGSTSPTANVADTVLRFLAVQGGTPNGLRVRVQATTTPNTESSWADLANDRSGLMTLDFAGNQFVLNSTDYPLQNGVYFRAVSAAPGYSDSISNVVGPFNLASTKPHLSPTRLSVTGNSNIADLYFRARESTVQSGVALRVQATTTPADDGSWTDLNNGNAGAMQQSTNSLYPNSFLLLVNNYPAGQGIYFRAVASLSGSVDSISQPVGAFNLISDVPPKVTMTPPSPALAGGGDGSSPDKPILLQSGFFSFGASVQSGQPLKYLGLGIDGTILRQLREW